MAGTYNGTAEFLKTCAIPLSSAGSGSAFALEVYNLVAARSWERVVQKMEGGYVHSLIGSPGRSQFLSTWAPTKGTALLPSSSSFLSAM